jgi:hypothetical protein
MMSPCDTIVMLRWTQAGERRDDLELAAKLSAVSFRSWPTSAFKQSRNAEYQLQPTDFRCLRLLVTVRQDSGPDTCSRLLSGKIVYEAIQ